MADRFFQGGLGQPDGSTGDRYPKYGESGQHQVQALTRRAKTGAVRQQYVVKMQVTLYVRGYQIR